MTKELSGGCAEQLSWLQTMEDVIVNVPLAASIKTVDIKVKIQATQLSIAFAGVQICSDRLANTVDPDESTWTLEGAGESRCLAVSLAKVHDSSSKQWPCLWKKDVAAAMPRSGDEYPDDPELSLKGYEHDSAPVCPKFIDVGGGTESVWAKDRPEYEGWKEAAKMFTKQTILDMVEQDGNESGERRTVVTEKQAEAPLLE